MMDGNQGGQSSAVENVSQRSDCSAAKCCSLCLAMEYDDLEEPVLLTASHWYASNLLQGNDVEKEAIGIDSFL